MKKNNKTYEAQLKEYNEFVENLIEDTWKKGHEAEMQMRQAHFKHFSDSEQFAKSVAKILDKATRQIVIATVARFPDFDQEKTFAFAQDKMLEKAVNKLLTEAFSSVRVVVQYGSKVGWEAAEQKNDAFVKKVFKEDKLAERKRALYMGRREEALAAFQKRKVDGLNLSERVWKLQEPFKEEIELAIDASISKGISAQKLSQEVRSCLQEPNKLFRRVRDKYGNLQLSKAAKLYHPGQGVYRSSYKNAMRLARTEINMAYRTSDFERWKRLDFVVGIKIQLSNNHTTTNPKGKGRIRLYDICDELAGNYPKEFKFVGWHPQCHCFATPILVPYDEMDDDIREAADGQQYIKFPASNAVLETPKNFNEYIRKNQKRIEGWKSKPYYIKDNQKFVDDITDKKS